MEIKTGYRVADDSDVPEGFEFKKERKLSEVFKMNQLLEICGKKVQVVEIRNGCVLLPTAEAIANWRRCQDFPFYFSQCPSAIEIKPKLTVMWFHDGKMERKSFEGDEINFLMPE
jgi:hypothetical protein